MSTDSDKEWRRSRWRKHQIAMLVNELLSVWRIIKSADEIVEWIVYTHEQFSQSQVLVAILEDGRSYAMIRASYWVPGPRGGWDILQWYAEARVANPYMANIGGRINGIRSLRGLPRIPYTVLAKRWFPVGHGKHVDLRTIAHPSNRLGKLHTAEE